MPNYICLEDAAPGNLYRDVTEWERIGCWTAGIAHTPRSTRGSMGSSMKRPKSSRAPINSRRGGSLSLIRETQIGQLAEIWCMTRSRANYRKSLCNGQIAERSGEARGVGIMEIPESARALK